MKSPDDRRKVLQIIDMGIAGARNESRNRNIDDAHLNGSSRNIFPGSHRFSMNLLRRLW